MAFNSGKLRVNDPQASFLLDTLRTVLDIVQWTITLTLEILVIVSNRQCFSYVVLVSTFWMTISLIATFAHSLELIIRLVFATLWVTMSVLPLIGQAVEILSKRLYSFHHCPCPPAHNGCCHVYWVGCENAFSCSASEKKTCSHLTKKVYFLKEKVLGL